MADIIVTDHAIIRYLERVAGVDIELLKKRILTDDLRNKIKVLGEGKIPSDGFIAYVVKNKITTIVNPDCEK